MASRASRRSRSSRRTATGSTTSAGNVWEWVSDWYRPDYYAQLAAAGGVARNPQGPDSTRSIRTSPARVKRVHRGGSFLCTDQYCSRYMVGTRGKGESQHRHEPPGVPDGQAVGPVLEIFGPATRVG